MSTDTRNIKETWNGEDSRDSVEVQRDRLLDTLEQILDMGAYQDDRFYRPRPPTSAAPGILAYDMAMVAKAALEAKEGD